MNEVTNLITCIKLSLSNKSVFLTDNDIEIFYLNEVYYPTACLKVEKIEQVNELGDDEFRVSFKLNLEYKLLNELNFMNGIIEIIIVDRVNLEAAPITKKKGFVSKVNKNKDFVWIEAKTLGAGFNENIGSLYSSRCRAIFGKEKCGIDIKKHSHQGVVSRVISNECIIDDKLLVQEQCYVGGVIQFFSVGLDKVAFRVTDNKIGSIAFVNDIHFKVTAGDQYIIYVPCDKSFGDCRDRFSNILNFRGEPFVPNRYKLVASNY